MQQIASKAHFDLQTLIIINNEAFTPLFGHTACMLHHIQSAINVAISHTRILHPLFVFKVRVLKPLLISLFNYMKVNV